MSVYLNNVPFWVWVILVFLLGIFGFFYFKKYASTGNTNTLKSKNGRNVNNGIMGDNNTVNKTVNNTFILNSDHHKESDSQIRENKKKHTPNWYDPKAGPRHKDYPKDKI